MEQKFSSWKRQTVQTKHLHTTMSERIHECQRAACFGKISNGERDEESGETTKKNLNCRSIALKQWKCVVNARIPSINQIKLSTALGFVSTFLCMCIWWEIILIDKAIIQNIRQWAWQTAHGMAHHSLRIPYLLSLSFYFAIRIWLLIRRKCIYIRMSASKTQKEILIFPLFH